MTERRYGILGDPVEHSASPAMYSAAFSILDVPARYVAHRVPRDDAPGLERMMRKLAGTGGGNVTVPHKQAAARLLEVRTGSVDSTECCNCFWLDPAGRLAGDNTDVGGFLAAVDELEELELEGASVLLLGAGGAARAVAVAAATAGIGRLDIRNRNADRARRLVADLGLEGIACAPPGSRAPSRAYDLVVNATSLGLGAADPLPLTLERDRFAFAFDLVYGSGGTAWTRHAAEVGVSAIDGRSMLVHQALLSLRCWMGSIPAREVLATMRQAVEDLLGPAG